MPIETTVYLVRHCEYEDTEGIIPGRLPGFPLSSNGRKCAKDLGHYFKDKNINHLYTSPITRTKETAAIIAKTLKLQPRVSPLAIEIKSTLEGQSREKINALAQVIYLHPDYFGGGGETMTAIFKRMHRLITHLRSQFTGKNIVVVSHGDPIMLLLYGLVDGDLEKYVQRRYPYVPMGGIIKLVFAKEKLTDWQQLNY
ncbi:MAG: histidine phosphatase family protein [Candidatus Chisholmbacteria bacterium]|nr:histidine phosphatase family protein [Candidatus Chisholmbacteria bacterium]